jgi:hypothetical protein
MSLTSNQENILFVDIQGFQTPEFTPKEMAFTYDGENIYTFIFKPNRPLTDLSKKSRQTKRWVESYYHGIPYNDGQHKLENLSTILSHFPADLVIAHGEEKKHVLEKFYSNVMNINDQYDLIFKKTLVTDCDNHKKLAYCACAKVNVKHLFNFYKEIK